MLLLLWICWLCKLAIPFLSIAIRKVWPYLCCVSTASSCPKSFSSVLNFFFSPIPNAYLLEGFFQHCYLTLGLTLLSWHEEVIVKLLYRFFSNSRSAVALCCHKSSITTQKLICSPLFVDTKQLYVLILLAAEWLSLVKRKRAALSCILFRRAVLVHFMLIAVFHGSLVRRKGCQFVSVFFSGGRFYRLITWSSFLFISVYWAV